MLLNQQFLARNYDNLFIHCFSLKQYYNHYNFFGWVKPTY